MSKVKLGEVAIEHKETCRENKDGYPVVGLEHLVPEEVTLTAWDEGCDNTFTKMFRKGNVLFGRRRAYLKKAAVAPFDGICSGDITVIEAIQDRILPELLPFIIQNDDLFDFAVGKSAGSLSPRVKWEHLKNYEFELPDMDKQRELAELLWAMNATKKSYQKLIAATDELVKSQFIEMSQSAESTTILTDICSPKQWATVATKDFTEAGYPVYGANGLIGYYTEYNHEHPTIMIACRGATCGSINVSSGKAYINGNAMCLDNVSERVNLRFLEYALRYYDFTNVITGSAQPQITANNLTQVKLLIPSIEVQIRFETLSIQLDKSKFELEQALSELTATYKRIIKENLG